MQIFNPRTNKISLKHKTPMLFESPFCLFGLRCVIYTFECGHVTMNTNVDDTEHLELIEKQSQARSDKNTNDIRQKNKNKKTKNKTILT